MTSHTGALAPSPTTLRALAISLLITKAAAVPVSQSIVRRFDPLYDPDPTRSHLPAQIAGLVGSYVGAVIIVTALMFLIRRHRERKARAAATKPPKTKVKAKENAFAAPVELNPHLNNVQFRNGSPTSPVPSTKSTHWDRLVPKGSGITGHKESPNITPETERTVVAQHEELSQIYDAALHKQQEILSRPYSRALSQSQGNHSRVFNSSLAHDDSFTQSAGPASTTDTWIPKFHAGHVVTHQPPRSHSRGASDRSASDPSGPVTFPSPARTRTNEHIQRARATTNQDDYTLEGDSTLSRFESQSRGHSRGQQSRTQSQSRASTRPGTGSPTFDSVSARTRSQLSSARPSALPLRPSQPTMRSFGSHDGPVQPQTVDLPLRNIGIASARPTDLPMRTLMDSEPTGELPLRSFGQSPAAPAFASPRPNDIIIAEPPPPSAGIPQGMLSARSFGWETPQQAAFGQQAVQAVVSPQQSSFSRGVLKSAASNVEFPQREILSRNILRDTRAWAASPGPLSAMSGDLPLRSHAVSSPNADIAEVALSYVPSRLGNGQKSGVPMTPASPYEPFAPMTPVMSPIPTRRELKQMRKQMDRNYIVEDEAY